jgi:hypothetical protein
VFASWADRCRRKRAHPSAKKTNRWLLGTIWVSIAPWGRDRSSAWAALDLLTEKLTSGFEKVDLATTERDAGRVGSLEKQLVKTLRETDRGDVADAAHATRALRYDAQVISARRKLANAFRLGRYC